VQLILEGDPQLIGSGLCSFRSCLGTAHYYKGPSGVIDSGVAGLVLGAAYMVAGRSLWASILAHGFIDTFGVIDAFSGWSN
jgi:hypothetical protein